MKQKSSYDAVIIGSGLGGLTCAAYLAKKKKKVLEKCNSQTME